MIFKKAKRALSVSRRSSESTGPRRVKVTGHCFVFMTYICERAKKLCSLSLAVARDRSMLRIKT